MKAKSKYDEGDACRQTGTKNLDDEKQKLGCEL